LSGHLVEIFLPLNYKDGTPVPVPVFTLIKEELAERFGGVTAYSRPPAEGLWKDGAKLERDTVTVWEVMTGKLDDDWWRSFRKRLEDLLRQDEVLIRATPVQTFSDPTG
jgi:hypothetical protein